MSDTATLQTLLVAQVLTLAKTLETMDKVKERSVAMNYKREAVRLLKQESAEVLALLAETR